MKKSLNNLNMSVNKCILIGNVGHIDVRNLQGGAKVATITLATTEKFKDREETEWHTVVIWNNLADVVEKYVKKGSQLYIEGRIKTEKYTKDGQDRFIVKIVASSLQLLGKKESGGESAPAPAPARPASTPLPTYDDASPSDDLPF